MGRAQRRRLVLLSVAGLLSISAVLAIGILLVGRFGEAEARILGTTMVLAGYGSVALPGVVLFDQGRLRALAAAASSSASLGACLAVASIWGSFESDTVGRAVGTVTVIALGLAQSSALAARRRPADPRAVGRLFVASCVVAGTAVVAAVTLIWSNPHGALYPRLAAALVVLDLLLVALQPVLARARPAEPVHRFSVVLSTGETVEICVAGGDDASAAARAIRKAEQGRGRLVRLEVGDDAARPRA